LLIGLVFSSLILAGCQGLSVSQTQKADAIAVWQHQGGTWDVYYSLWDHDAKAWYTPSGSMSAPIAVDAGDDNDPDVSSTDTSAIAVWSKATGGDAIYYSVWQGSSWSAPAELGSGDTETDPTVAMDPDGNALSVWVSGGNLLSYSYYTKGTGWSTPKRIPTPGIGRVSLPELTYNPMDGLYYLVFTGSDGVGANAYAAGYGTSAGWSNVALMGSGAVLDNGVPTTQRTGISASESANEVTAVWPGSDGNVYSAVLGSSGRNFNDGKMPDDAYDSAGAANGAFTRAGDLFHQKDVNDPNSGVNLVSGLSEEDQRASLTFIRNRTVGLVLWWTKVVPPAQVYYSYYDNGQWSGVGEVDKALGGTYNRNPAVSPLRKQRKVEKLPYCGDGILDWPWEQCEVGIACANPNQACNLATCQCEQPPYNKSVYCADNTIATAFGFPPIFGPGVMCKDDCRASLGKDYVCDAVSCTCSKKPPPPPTNLSCAGNTFSAAFGGSNFKAGMQCKDDCKTLGSDYVCDAQTCVCEQKPPPKPVSCADNSWDEFFGVNNTFKPGMQCKDDCEEQFGQGVICDPVTCVCNQAPRNNTVYCAGNTNEVSRTDKNNFSAASMKCEDNCKELGEGFECNPQSCTCTKPPNGTVSCSGRSFDSLFGTPAAFNGSAAQCKDDCAETFDSLNVVCNAQTCMCEAADFTCAGNTLDTEDLGANVFAGGQCKDNCDKLGPGYQCDPQACLCRRKPGDKVYCAANTEDALVRSAEKAGPGTFSSGVQQCIDNCEDFGDNYACDPQTCYCEPKANKNVSCSFNTQLVDATDSNAFSAATMQCKDDCAESLGSAYECNAQSCTCTKKPANATSCMGNSINTLFSNNTFNPALARCQDDCDSILFGSWACNPQTCICDPAPPKVTCAGNTLDIIDGYGNGYNSSYRCEDNCDRLGQGYQCDAQSCVCRKKPGTEVYCGANTDEAFVTHELNGSSQPFNSATMQCKDNCKEVYGDGVTCDAQSCLCVPAPNTTVTCASVTDFVNVTDTNPFNPATMKCQDDCQELGPGYECNAQSCTCTKSTEATCSSNTWAVNVPKGQLPAGAQCKDDCKSLGASYVCDPEGCFCKETRTVTPRCGDGYVSGPNVPGGGNEECDVGYGTYQPKDAAGNPINTPDTCPPPTMCDAASCKCVQPVTEGFCGDGKVSGGEQCDWNSSATNKCSAGSYCTDSCQCKQLETSPRCGDGKISVETGEQCDGGSVTTNICQAGYKCYTPECVCVPQETTAQCGDGTVTPPEECDIGNTYTAECPGGKTCSSCKCVDYESLVHGECDYAHQTCVAVEGPGQNECTSDADCETTQTPVCGNGVREGSEQCDGSSAGCDSGQSCNSKCQCVTSQTQPQYHTECDFSHGQCIQVQGSGSNQCSSDSQCSPPVVDCPAYCSGQGFSQSLGSGFTSAQACSAEAQESATQCTTKCVYTKFYSTSNQAGTTTCCCKDVKTFACSDCPGQNPSCPDPDVVCPANQP
jgi:hypothetical protein